MKDPAAKARSGDAERAAIEPIVVTVPLGCPPERAFAYFTRDIAKWWPLAKYSVCGDRAADVAFEPRAGGEMAFGAYSSAHGTAALQTDSARAALTLCNRLGRG